MKKITLLLVGLICINETFAAETPDKVKMPGRYITTEIIDYPSSDMKAYHIKCNLTIQEVCYTIKINPQPTSSGIVNNTLVTGIQNPQSTIIVNKASGELIFQGVLTNYEKYQVMDNTNIVLNHEFKVIPSN